ncbi:MAG: type II toxin-antitoxin system PemK/MazF family toxin [Caldiserica bacterium]|nr:MAG: type II toxin-antitoxin system PemK/MazF family toxin [Caldisericota bacterium]
MARFIRADVVVVPFPFSDLTRAKRRPALVLAELEGDDIILCQITSQTVKDKYSILLEDKDFIAGSLKKISNIRPNRIFTADERIVLYKVGQIKKEKMNEVVGKVIEILKGEE